MTFATNKRVHIQRQLDLLLNDKNAMETQGSVREKWLRRLGPIGTVLLDSLHMFSFDVCGIVGSYVLSGVASIDRPANMTGIITNAKCVALAVHPVDGRLWLGHEQGNEIIVLNPENLSSDTIHLPLTGVCYSIAFHPCCSPSDAVVAHSLELWKIHDHAWTNTTWQNLSELRTHIVAFAYDSQGIGYWTRGRDTIGRLGKHGELTTIGAQETGDEYYGVCIGRSCMAGSERDVLCVAEGRTGRLCWYDVEEKRWIQRQPLDFAFRCDGIAIDRTGQWLAADSRNQCIHVFGTDGIWLCALGKGHMDSPRSPCVGLDGRLYVADKERIRVFAFDL